MSRQRNNIATLQYDHRKLVSRLLFEGRPYAEIRDALTGSGCSVKLHNSSFLAWQKKSPEYLRYRTAREADEQESAIVRAQAEALNDGRGPESMADLTVMEVVKELYKQTKGGAITDLSDLANVTKALAPLLRVGIARDLAAAKTRETDLKSEISNLKSQAEAAQKAHEEEIARLQAEITNIKAGGKVDLTQAAANVAKILGGGQ